MTEPDKLKGPIRLTPKAERERYAEEWRGDAQAASSEQMSRDVVVGAYKVAVRRRERALGRTLVGASGAGRAMLAWGTIALLLLAGFILGGPVGAVVGVVVVMSAVALSDAHRSVAVRRVQIGSALLAVGALVYTEWAFYNLVDAADLGVAAPPAAQFLWLGPVLLLLAALSFVVVTIRGIRTSPSR